MGRKRGEGADERFTILTCLDIANSTEVLPGLRSVSGAHIVQLRVFFTCARTTTAYRYPLTSPQAVRDR